MGKTRQRINRQICFTSVQGCKCSRVGRALLASACTCPALCLWPGVRTSAKNNGVCEHTVPVSNPAVGAIWQGDQPSGPDLTGTQNCQGSSAHGHHAYVSSLWKSRLNAGVVNALSEGARVRAARNACNDEVGAGISAVQVPRHPRRPCGRCLRPSARQSTRSPSNCPRPAASAGSRRSPGTQGSL
eukprot:UN1647